MKQLNLTNATDSTLEIINGVPMMCSREIAKFADKEHGKVCRDIRVMLEKLYGISDADSTRNPDLAYLTNHGVICRQYDTDNPNAWEYLLDHEHSDCLVAGYDPVRRMAIIKQWRALEREVSQLQIAAQPAPQPTSANADILSLARVVAEATASATMKAVMEVTTQYAPPAKVIESSTPNNRTPFAAFYSLFASKPQPEDSAQEPAQTTRHEDTPPADSAEYVRVTKISWETTFSDAACRRLIRFANLPTQKYKGSHGLLVHRESFMLALRELIEESTPPTGKLKRWQHPEFRGFELKKDPTEIFGEEK